MTPPVRIFKGSIFKWFWGSIKNWQKGSKLNGFSTDETVVYSTSEWELPDSATDGSTSFSSATVTLSAGTYYVCVLSATKSNLGDTRPVSGSVTGTVQTNARFVPDYSAKTIICKNGLVSANDAEHYFKVQNTDDGQKIYAVGLGESGDSGQLIKKKGAYKDFGDKLRKFMHSYIKPTAKESGFSAALDDIVDALPDDIFITSV